MTYTAMAGEKHLVPSKIGDATYDTPTPGTIFPDYRGTRILALGLSQRPDDTTNPQTTTVAPVGPSSGHYMYGSWHPGITQFVFGDTRVSSVKNFASTAALISMGERGDGIPYDLP